MTCARPGCPSAWPQDSLCICHGCHEGFCYSHFAAHDCAFYAGLELRRWSQRTLRRVLLWML